MHDDVAGRHRRDALEELGRCPHLHFIGPGAAQLVVRALTLLQVRLRFMDGQRAAHSSCQDPAEVVASLVVVEEADAVSTGGVVCVSFRVLPRERAEAEERVVTRMSRCDGTLSPSVW